MQMEQIGKGIAARRKQQGLSQEELSLQLGVTRQAVSRWESGIALPSVDNMIGLSKALSISVDELLQLPGQSQDTGLSVESVGRLLDEHNAHQEKRIRRMTHALVISACILVAGIMLSMVLGILRSNRMEERLNERIASNDRQISALLSGFNARVDNTVRQALSDGNTRLTDSGQRAVRYDAANQAFAITLYAYPQVLGEYADAEFYLTRSDGSRISTAAELVNGGFEGTILIPDNGQDMISANAYVTWKENGEQITERIDFYDVMTYRLRLEILYASMDHTIRPGQALQVRPRASISYSIEDEETYPTSIRYELYRNDALIHTLEEPISIRRNDSSASLTAYYEHAFSEPLTIEGAADTEGLLLRVIVTDARGNEFIAEHIPE